MAEVDPIVQTLERFKIHPTRGFVADPFRHDSVSWLEEFEELLMLAPDLNKQGALRGEIESLPQISQSQIDCLNELQIRRAYVVFSMLGNVYVWCEGRDKAVDVLTSVISLPLEMLCEKLGIAMITTHYSVVLWNYHLVDSQGGLKMENCRMTRLFTGTPDEEWFYRITLGIEIDGAHIPYQFVKLISSIKGELDQPVSNSLVREALDEIASTIAKMTATLSRMAEHNHPDVFYHVLRPYLAGWKNSDTHPDGLVYEGVNDDEPLFYSGASAAQSTLIACIDVALGVDRYSKLSPQEKSDHFLYQMRQYMPRRSREFLEYLDDNNFVIRDYAKDNDDLEIRAAYDMCVENLKLFRDLHIQIVTRFITNPGSKDKSKSELAVRGTGGTNLHKFLKRTRTEAYIPIETKTDVLKTEVSAE